VIDLAPVAAWFGECYGRDPQCVWQAPGRANLIGEHTDYNDGLVLPFALQRGTVAAASRRAGDLLELRSRQSRGPVAAVRIGELEPGAVTGWAAYPAGVAWALREAGYRVSGASVAIDSDLPQGAGLSSSAALSCAAVLACACLSGLSIPRPALAELARRAENDFVGMPCGIMDQSASLLCQAGHALLLDCRSGTCSQVPLALADSGAALMIIDTRASHELTDGEYAARREECAAAARALGVSSLRDLTDDSQLAGQLSDPVLRRRARHVLTENRRVEDTVRLLRDGDVSAVGSLISESHRSLRDDFEVSWPEADQAVQAAESAGALGARMMGGGFGGSVLALVPGDRAALVRDAVAAAFAGRGWGQPEFLDATPSDGARRIG
jgi:galactokinase